MPLSVIPAKAGIQHRSPCNASDWIPAFAGMTSFTEMLPRLSRMIGRDARCDKLPFLFRMHPMNDTWLDQILWTADGLVPAIAQDAASGKILMMAWMNRESLARTRELGEAVYWSRSRQQLWHKGESSGHIQHIKGIFLDCDGDTLLLKVEQQGGIACHTGRESCFYRTHSEDAWREIAPVIKTPAEIYGEQS